ncbi:hypothetical protein ES702_00235 [subsurface metagenome]
MGTGTRTANCPVAFASVSVCQTSVKVSIHSLCAYAYVALERDLSTTEYRMREKV